MRGITLPQIGVIEIAFIDEATTRTLEFERGATLWLEARRLWDLRRWGADPGPARVRITWPSFFSIVKVTEYPLARKSPDCFCI